MALKRNHHVSCLPLAAVAAGIFLAIFGSARADTVRAASVSFADVSSAVSLAADGDTVLLPAGTATWTSTLKINKNIILQGATTITGDPSNFEINDATVVKDGLATAGNVITCTFTPDAGNHNPVIKGITFDGTVGLVTGGQVLNIGGTHHAVRVTQCNFWKNKKYAFWTGGDIWGVMDHSSSTQDSGSEKISTNHPSYGGGAFGDKSWTDGPNFGTDHAWFFEDCAFISVTNPATGLGKHGGLDAQSGGRRVIRHCYSLGVPPSLHGTETGGRQRGCRMVETYLNNFDMRGAGPTATGIQHRAGTGLYWGNTFLTDSTFDRNLELIANRQIGAFAPWGGASGKNPLDCNDTEGDGSYVAGHAPHMHFNGTVSTMAVDSCRMAGANWATDQWKDFEVTNNATGKNSLIQGNTSDTLTLAGQKVGTSTFTAGDTFVIYRLARASLDQPGMGKGDLLTGNPPTNSQWLNQQSEPLYAWLNTNNGSNYLGFLKVAHTPTIQENRDFFNWNTSFDGKTGVGTGLRSDRPSTCTKGVGYWATDEKTFYVATANNTWSVYYKPYVYPHPLATGVPAPSNTPAAPRNLKVVPTP